MNILGILKEKFSPTEPIFDYEIYDLGYSDRDIDDTLEKMYLRSLKMSCL